ncbi:MAG TPA: VOC family protein [Streptosporangiaceae bacterium]|nr:VOC family protein [Streptosporangiaceae bacterium]
MAKGIQVTFDAADPHALARWWADLMGYQVEDAHDRVTRLLGDASSARTR